jgi:hypothetical protein
MRAKRIHWVSMAVAMAAAFIALIGPASAFAAPPTATTGTATTSEGTKATLNGTVNPQGLATTYVFEYGPTTAYGSISPTYPASVGSGGTPVAVKQAVNGLAPSTKCHFRVVATNAEGTSKSSDGTFTTGAAPAKVANMSAALAALTTRDGFGPTENPLSRGGAWTALFWDNSPDGHNTGQVYTNGWGPANASPTVNGASWTVAPFTDTGTGEAIVVRMMTHAGAGQYSSLWLDMPSPGTAKTGYELRFKLLGAYYQISFTKWQAGVATPISGSTEIALAPGLQLGFVDKGSKLSFYLGNGEGFFGEVWSTTDSAFNSGYAGMEGSGVMRLRDLQAGSLAAF